MSKELKTRSQIFIGCSVTADSWNRTKKMAKTEISASEFNRTLVSFSARCSLKFNTAASQVHRFPSTEPTAWYPEDVASLLQDWLPAVLLYVHILISLSLIFCIYLFLFTHCNSTVCMCAYVRTIINIILRLHLKEKKKGRKIYLLL